MIFWYKSTIKKAFDSLVKNEQTMKRKWRSEKDARKLFSQENSRKFIGLLINKARMLRQARLDLGVVEDHSDAMSVCDQANLWKKGPGSK